MGEYDRACIISGFDHDPFLGLTSRLDNPLRWLGQMALLGWGTVLTYCQNAVKMYFSPSRTRHSFFELIFTLLTISILMRSSCSLVCRRRLSGRHPPPRRSCRYCPWLCSHFTFMFRTFLLLPLSLLSSLFPLRRFLSLDLKWWKKITITYFHKIWIFDRPKLPGNSNLLKLSR